MANIPDFSVLGAPLTNIEIGASGIREIAQNVQTILATVRGTVFLDRTFGLNGEMVDKPLPVAMAYYSGDVVQEVEKQEPRVKVVSVSFEPSDAANGELIPKVMIRIRPGVLL